MDRLIEAVARARGIFFSMRAAPRIIEVIPQTVNPVNTG
jgi:hypothetical protein